MLIGPLCGSWDRRRSSQASSPHRKPDSTTTDAVAGGTSVPFASGSAFCRQVPSAPRTSNLYRAPAVTPGTKISQTPESPSDRMAWVVPCQWLKSPTTRTARALGAQTANAVPSTSPRAPG
jgi:hypothetical protein